MKVIEDKQKEEFSKVTKMSNDMMAIIKKLEKAVVTVTLPSS
jgi:hypothetical protein